jgi:hypothetical protein
MLTHQFHWKLGRRYQENSFHDIFGELPEKQLRYTVKLPIKKTVIYRVLEKIVAG